MERSDNPDRPLLAPHSPSSVELRESSQAKPGSSAGASVSPDNAVLSRSSLLVEHYPDFDPKTKQNIRLAGLYLKDAEKGRCINENLTKEDPDQYFDQDTRIKGYQFAVHKYWSKFVYIMIWLHLIMFNFEPVPPKPLSVIWVGPPRSPILVALEFFILTVYSIDFALHFYTHDPKNWCHPRVGSRIIWSDVCCRKPQGIGRGEILVSLILINAIDLIIAASTRTVVMRFSAILRPGFLIIRARWVRHALFSMMQSTKQLAKLALFLTVPLFAFSFVAYAMFSPKSPTPYSVGIHPGTNSSLCTPPSIMCPANQVAGNTFFATYRKGLESLIVLTTSSNFPDVMMQSYHAKPLTAVFFLFFAYMANFFVMPIIFATVFSQFTKNEKEYAQLMHDRILEAQDRAFELVKSNDTDATDLESGRQQSLHERINLDDEAKREAGDESRSNEQTETGKMFYDTFRELMRQLVPRIKPPQIRILYNAALGIRGRDGEANNETNVVTPESSQIGYLGRGINRKQFQYVVDHARTTVVIPNALRAEDDDPHCEGLSTKFRIFQSKIVYLYQQPRVKKRVLFFTVLNIGAIVGQLFLPHLVWIRYVADVFLGSFAAEKVLLLFAYGSNIPTLEIFDTVIVLGSVAIKALTFVLGWNENMFMVFRVFTVFFIMTQLPLFDTMFNISVSVMKYASGLFAVEFIVFYVFSVIGMFLFSNAVSRQVAWDHISAGNDVAYWQNILAILYYNNNFNSLWRSMVTLAELTVVNNWMVIYGMYVKTMGPSAILYFYAFYIIAVLFAMNAIMSLIVDIFLKLYEKSEKPVKQTDRERRIKNVLQFEFGRENMRAAEIEKDDFVLLRHVPKSEFYQGLYLPTLDAKSEDGQFEDDPSDDSDGSDGRHRPDVVLSNFRRFVGTLRRLSFQTESDLQQELMPSQERDENT